MKKNPADEFYKEVGNYLKSRGWNAAVIGPMRIIGGFRKYKFTLEIEFLGGKRKP